MGVFLILFFNEADWFYFFFFSLIWEQVIIEFGAFMVYIFKMYERHQNAVTGSSQLSSLNQKRSIKMLKVMGRFWKAQEGLVFLTFIALMGIGKLIAICALKLSPNYNKKGDHWKKDWGLADSCITSWCAATGALMGFVLHEYCPLTKILFLCSLWKICA